MASSVMFFEKTWHVEASGNLDFFEGAVWRHFRVLVYIFVTFETWSPFSLSVLKEIAMTFSCKTPAVFGRLHLTFNWHEDE